MIKNILLVGLGGAAGTVLRYLCQKWIGNITSISFPLGTFLVNIAGCFLIGLFFSYSIKHEYFNYNMQLLLMTGLCGGFTTFSAFTLEGMGLISDNKTGLFLLYIGGSVILGLLATWLGIKIAR